MPDFIAKCDVCEEWSHKDRLVDSVCEECREMARQKMAADLEYNHHLTAFLKGEAPSIAPNGQFAEIWTPRGRHRVKWKKEWTGLDKRQRLTARERGR